MNTTLVIGTCLLMTAVLVAPTAAACLDLMPRTTTIDRTLYAVATTAWELRAQAEACGDSVEGGSNATCA